jgi:hypothetical protein
MKTRWSILCIYFWNLPLNFGFTSYCHAYLFLKYHKNISCAKATMETTKSCLSRDISKKILIFWNYFLKGKAWQCIWAWDTYVSWLSAERGGCKNFDQRSCHKSWCFKGSHGHLSNFLYSYILNNYIMI